MYFVCPIAVGLRRYQNTLTCFVKQMPSFTLIFFLNKKIVVFALQKLCWKERVIQMSFYLTKLALRDLSKGCLTIVGLEIKRETLKIFPSTHRSFYKEVLFKQCSSTEKKGGILPEMSPASTILRGLNNHRVISDFTVFDENLVREITWLSWRHRFQNASFSKCLPNHAKTKSRRL